MKKIQERIEALGVMKKYPSQLYYEGNLALLKAKKVSIVGTRKPSKYSRDLTFKLSSALSKVGVCVVSGGAMGIDAVAHKGASSCNTIAILPCGIDIKYPSINKNLLLDIEQNGLLLSQFDISFRATPWSFVVRNELVVALGDVLVVTEAELESGSMRSVEFALKMGKEIFVFPQRVGESGATNKLLLEGKAKAIYDIDEFVSRFAQKELLHAKSDEFLEFCKTSPTYEETLKRYPHRVFEAELNGDIAIQNGKIIIL
jgi:DNA processing protein